MGNLSPLCLLKFVKFVTLTYLISHLIASKDLVAFLFKRETARTPLLIMIRSGDGYINVHGRIFDCELLLLVHINSI